MQAWRHVRALRDPGAWDAWLYRLTVHACTGGADQRRRNIVELHVTPDQSRQPNSTSPCPSPSVIGSAASSVDCPSTSAP